MAGTAADSRAGLSADGQADLYADAAAQTEDQIRTLLEALRELRRREGTFRTGAEGERATHQRVQQVLVDLGAADWHLLADRRWPGTRSANIDLLLVGPPGVLVLDVKTWREPRIADGSLWCGQDRADGELDKVRRQADAVTAALVDIGLAPAVVQPVIVLTRRTSPGTRVGGVLVVGDRCLHRELARLGARLDADQVVRCAAALDGVCPSASADRPALRVPRAHGAPAGPARTGHDDPLALVELQQVYAAAMEAAARGPIETWMAWLHPSQAQLAARRFSGPARIRGPAGTGKTVVGLHRARHLARRPGARVLVTSYVRTLPQVQQALFARLAPDLAAVVEFRGVHAWAMRLLRARGANPRHEGADRVFAAAYAGSPQRGVLAASGLPDRYWRDEVRAVIKSRGLTDLDAYLALDRVGRRTPLREEQRRAVWALYEDYQRRLREAGGCDWEDVLLDALDSVRREPIDPPYTAVLIDEVQDLTCTGLRLLHAIVGDAPDGLFLVGDGQQAVYPGGFTLAEAGVSVAGRAAVLTGNYRNAEAILRRAMAVVSDDAYDDLDPGSETGVRTVAAHRPGGQVATVTCDTPAAQRAALLSALRWTLADGTRPGDLAILVPSNRQVDRWCAVLAAAGVAAEPLTSYRGDSDDAVKVGTYQRAKGLEFACVFLPDHDRAVPGPQDGEDPDAYDDRAALARRQLFVAMTRARDRLWLGRVGNGDAGGHAVDGVSARDPRA